MPGIVILTCPTPHAWIVINALIERFGPLTILTEGRQSRRDLLLRRIKRQGIIAVLGQVGFVLFQKLVERRSRSRVDEIIHANNLDPEPDNADCTIMPVGSVNSMACRTALAMLKPDAVLVIGTRIIGKETLTSITVPLINYHAGITPEYRGQAGGYWALASGDPENAGVTLHLVDQGVDTGGILYQAHFIATERDSFPTYFYLQAAAARPLAIKALEDALSGKLKVTASDLPSGLHYHPTLWGYFAAGLKRGVW